MPYALAMDKMIRVLSSEAVNQIRSETPEVIDQLRERGSLVDAAKQLAGLTDDEASYLEAIPTALMEGMRAAITEALDSGKAVHLQYSPAYDFSVQLWDYGDAVSIHVSGPYPPDYPRDSYQRSS
jgi:hypothetical protein